jgi:gamma-carbonic anhydrase
MALIRPHKGIRPVIAEDVFLAETAVVIGDVSIGAGSGIWYGCVLRGDVASIKIGARTNIQDGSVVHVTGQTWPTIVGDDVTVGHMALLHGCVIESGAFVGMGSIVMDGCVIEEGAMIAAGAMLTPGKRIPKGELWGGRPAQFLRPVKDEERVMFQSSAAGYARLAQEYRKA